MSALLDDPDFAVINERLSRFNLFEAVGAVRSELRHSNFLAYLLSPSRPHGLGSIPLRQFVRAGLERIEPAARPLMTLELLVGDLDDAIVYRERENIDLLIELASLKLVVLVENKVGAKAGVGQLAGYKQIVTARYPDHRRLLIFLTPDGAHPDDPDYVAMSFASLAQILEDLNAGQTSPETEAQLIVRHYVEMLRRHIVQDEELKDLAARLYERHSEAFDFIFEARPAPRGLLDVVKGGVVGCIGLTIDSEGANLLRFLPERWDERLTASHCKSTKWSKSGRGVLFEAKTYSAAPGRVNLSLIIGPCDPAFRAHVYAAAQAHPSLFKGIVKPMSPQVTTIYSRDFLTVDQAKGLSAEAKAFNVGVAWSDFQGTDLNALTEAIIEAEALFTPAAI